MATLDPSREAFEAAKRAFRKTLKDDGKYRDLLKIDSADKVYEAIERLQKTQDDQRRIGRINKVTTFLDKLEGYHKAVDTFVQVKPEIMALVWGPICVLLTMADNVTKLFDGIVTAMEQIGDALPHFRDVVKIFDNKDILRDKLALFYEDILEFYTVAFRTSNMSSKFYSSSSPCGTTLEGRICELTIFRAKHLLRICVAQTKG